MAIFNEILVGRFNKSLQKVFGIKGSPPVRQLGGEITPSWQIMNGVEMRYLEQWNRFSASVLVAANVGNTSQFRFTNNIGSNVLAVIEKLIISTSVAGEVDIVNVARQVLVSGAVPDLTTFAPFIMDARAGDTTTGSTCHVSSSNVTNQIATVSGRVQTLALTSIDLIVDEDHQWAILPQTLFQVQTQVANNQLIAWIIWRERYLEESERQ